ncbi:MAG: NarK/NasA family nitrate transporter [Alphaproteobacteria bacterium]|nr:NarK/NasA family nitrate transporter [Alphaproteobacteria bacterium]MDD9919065.1 NarK/NasA family nitrate transporter [Alphaproteobacteria bacterium]
MRVTIADQHRAVTSSTLAFTVCFAVWTIFSILGLKIKTELGLSDTQFGILVATPVLTGSLSRLILGIWTDQYGGRKVFALTMLASALATFILPMATTYPLLLAAALGVGLAGGSFAVGVAYVSQWYTHDKQHQGTALGIFGMGNVGAAVTNFGAPFLVLALGWQQTAQVYAVIMAVSAVLFFLVTKDDPHLVERRKKKEKPRSILEQMTPLAKLQVWRFSLYYFFVFGAFVALALWLPRYYVGVYGVSLQTAGMLAAAYALPGSIFRALGGYFSDRYGARTVMYWTFLASLVCLFFMSYPLTDYVVHGIQQNIGFTIGIPLPVFVGLTIILGFYMSLGKAAVYKHIPVYYPDHVGAVGGMVGLIGGLGGFCLPILFGVMNDIIGVWTSCFMLLFVLTAVATVWMHMAISRMEARKNPKRGVPRYLPELDKLNPKLSK